MCPLLQDARPAIGDQAYGEHRHDGAGRAVDGLHHAGTESGACTRPMRFPGRIYKLSLDGKVLGMFGKVRQAARRNSDGYTRSRARLKTCCTSPRF